MSDEFTETREQERARKRVLKWWKADCGWGRKEFRQPSVPAERVDLPGPLDPGEAHQYGCEPAPASKQPRYRSNPPVVGQWMEKQEAQHGPSTA